MDQRLRHRNGRHYLSVTVALLDRDETRRLKHRRFRAPQKRSTLRLRLSKRKASVAKRSGVVRLWVRQGFDSPSDDDRKFERNRLVRRSITAKSNRGAPTISAAGLEEYRDCSAASLRPGSDLSRCDLRGADLKRADLTGANLDDSLFDGADLTAITAENASGEGASLRNTGLYRSNFSQARMNHSAWTGADCSKGADSPRKMTPTTFPQSLEGAIMKELDCNGFRSFANRQHDKTRSPAAELTGNLAGANLLSARLGAAKMSGVNLTGATLTLADFSGAKLESATLSRVRASQAKFAVAGGTRANLRNAQMEWADFSRAEFGADMASAIAYRSLFISTNVAAGTVMPANLNDTDFTDAMLAGVDMNNRELGTVNLTGAQMPGANFNDSRMDNVRMENADLSGGTMKDARAPNGNFRNTRFVNASISGANMSNSSWDYANISDAYVHGTNLEGARGWDTVVIDDDTGFGHHWWQVGISAAICPNGIKATKPGNDCWHTLS
ncbi:MAG: pentapeptide repeat-containing protein [Actinomycetia bacterium]|nr:pentapeptide repeat-containing protein [Actinomycetes bacterium]